MKHPIERAISSQKIFYKMFFPPNRNIMLHRKFVQPIFPNFKSEYIHQHFLKFAWNFLYSMYHVEDYFYQYDLRLLPTKEFPPMFTFTKYELRLLTDVEPEFEIVRLKREAIHEAFDYFSKMVNNFWEEKQRELGMFHSKISFPDFVYAYFVYSTRVVWDTNIPTLLPYLHYLNTDNTL